MEVAEERKCRRAWWEFSLFISIDIGEENFDGEEGGKAKKDVLEGEGPIHGKKGMKICSSHN